MPKLHHQKKSPHVLAYQANAKRVRLEARIVLDDVLNDALDELARQHASAETLGHEVGSVELDQAAIKALLLGSAQRQLGPGE